MQLKPNITIGYNYDESLHDFETYIPEYPINIHCYWNGIFGDKQLFSVISLIATQKRYPYILNIWLNKDTKIDSSINDIFLKLRCRYEKQICVRYSTVSEITKHTPLHNNNLNYYKQDNISDIIRFSLLYKYGGLWFDLDCCFLKDIRDLFKYDFVYNWEFQNYANSAVFYIQTKENEIITKLSDIATKGGCRPWEIFRFEYSHMEKIGVYPCWMFDPHWRNCTKDDIFQNSKNFHFFFKSQDIIHSIKQFYPNAYVYHWHNCWNSKIENHSCVDILFKHFKMELKI